MAPFKLRCLPHFKEHEEIWLDISHLMNWIKRIILWICYKIARKGTNYETFSP